MLHADVRLTAWFITGQSSSTLSGGLAVLYSATWLVAVGGREEYSTAVRNSLGSYHAERIPVVLPINYIFQKLITRRHQLRTTLRDE